MVLDDYAKEEFSEAFKAFRENKDDIKALNESNRDLCKSLDDKYQLEKGTTKAWMARQLKIEEGKDLTESVLELDREIKVNG